MSTAALPESDDARPAQTSSAWRIAIVLTLAVGAARVLLAAVVPLFPDETYYWEWSRSLAAGYFDHPPGVALFIAGGTALLGNTVLGVRLLSVLGGLIASLALAVLARRLAGDRAGMHAAIILACMPLAATGLVLATPDAPLLTFGALGVLALERALSAAPGSASSLRWWILAGLALGAAFVSKYMAVLLPFGIVLACLLHGDLRRRFFEPGPYVASIIALAMFAPVVWWNATHEWISFRFQLGHGFGTGARGGSAVVRLLELIGSQLGLATPIIFVLMVIVVTLALRRRFGDPRHFALAMIAATVLLFFAVSALRKPVEANWTAAAYLGAIPLLAAATVAGLWTRTIRAGYLLGGALVLIVWLHALVPILPVSARKDPIARAHGWSTLAGSADSLARTIVAAGGRVHIVADRYQDASELSFHLPGQPRVPALNLGGRRNQYDLWQTFPHTMQRGDDLLYVLGETEDVHPSVALLGPHFGTAERGPLVELRRGEGVAARRRIWLLREWRGGWP